MKKIILLCLWVISLRASHIEAPPARSRRVVPNVAAVVAQGSEQNVHASQSPASNNQDPEQSILALMQQLTPEQLAHLQQSISELMKDKQKQ